MIDFDSIDDWSPLLASALSECVSPSVAQALQVAHPEYVEDACQLLFELSNREAIIDATLDWLRGGTLCAYHGSRLTNDEIESIRVMGLIPLSAESRRDRLMRALSRHPRWSEVSGSLDEALVLHGQGNRAGHREGQVHLTLSKSGLTEGFNGYLTHGAEFDKHVATALLGPEGTELLAQDGKSTLITVAVPGVAALDAAHPFLGIEDLRDRGDLPNIVGDILYSWSYRLAYSNFQCRSLEVDCGMVFRTTIPPEWIVGIEEV